MSGSSNTDPLTGALDTTAPARETLRVLLAGHSQRQIARTLNAAYATGLLSEDTFVSRLDRLLERGVIDPAGLVGDLNLRGANRARLRNLALAIRCRLGLISDETARTAAESSTLLALDWSGADGELLLGRHHGCDVVLCETSVSRHHARLKFRDGRWILQDLDSTNGTIVNGVRVGRCELRPGDLIRIGETQLMID